MKRLKCPFCGNEEKFSTGRVTQDSGRRMYIYTRCEICKAQGPRITVQCKSLEDRETARGSKKLEELCVEQWNMRNEG